MDQTEFRTESPQVHCMRPTVPPPINHEHLRGAQSVARESHQYGMHESRHLAIGLSEGTICAGFGACSAFPALDGSLGYGTPQSINTIRTALIRFLVNPEDSGQPGR